MSYVELNLDKKLSELLPEELQIGQNLLTRYGAIGNSMIIHKECDPQKRSVLFTIVTDFGNVVRHLSYKEIKNIFNLEETFVQVSDVKGRLRKQIELLTTVLEGGW